MTFAKIIPPPDFQFSQTGNTFFKMLAVKKQDHKLAACQKTSQSDSPREFND